jgi:hypothetical protein
MGVVVVECPECGHRVMIDTDLPAYVDRVTCGCGEFVTMDTVRESV